jgi:hypothetical protein
MQSVPRLYRENQLEFKVSTRVETGSNTSTVVLRVVVGKEKGTECLGEYLDHPVAEGHKYEELALQVVGVSNLRQ